MLTGYEGPAFNAPDNTVQRRPSIGSWVTYGLGSEKQNLPAYVVLDDPLGAGGEPGLFSLLSIAAPRCRDVFV